MKEMIRLFREAQQYSLSVYEGKFQNLCRERIIQFEEDAGIFVLKKEYYSIETGLSDKVSSMDYLSV